MRLDLEGVYHYEDKDIRLLKETMFTWLTPYYKLETCEFNEEDEFQRMNYFDYLRLWMRRWNKEARRQKYIIVYNNREEGVNLITLMEQLEEL